MEANEQQIQTLKQTQQEWKMIIKFYDNPIVQNQIPRTQQIIDSYQAYKDNALKSHDSMSDYFWETDLRYKFQRANNADFILLPNNYPYDFKQLQHYVFWINKTADAQKYTTDFAKKVAKEMFPNAPQIYVFDNPAQFKSLPGIRHYQVFIQKAASL